VSWRKRKRFEPITMIGIIVTILLHGGSVVGIFFYRRALQAAQKPPPPPSYVVAKLLRKGKPKDDKKLPDKIVPQVATRKARGIDYTADSDAAPSKKKKRPDREAKIANKMRDSLARAELMAAAQREIEQEGSPDGVVGGTATKRTGGDAYMTKIADLWLRTWSLPAIIPKSEAKKLHVLVMLRIDNSGKIKFPLQFDRKSGNTHFDNSIIAAWKQIKKIPKPPPDRYASILANGLGLKHTWRGLR